MFGTKEAVGRNAGFDGEFSFYARKRKRMFSQVEVFDAKG